MVAEKNNESISGALTIIWHFIYASVHWLRHSLCDPRSKDLCKGTTYNIMMSSNGRQHSIILVVLDFIFTTCVFWFKSMLGDGFDWSLRSSVIEWCRLFDSNLEHDRHLQMISCEFPIRIVHIRNGHECRFSSRIFIDIRNESSIMSESVVFHCIQYLQQRYVNTGI